MPERPPHGKRNGRISGGCDRPSLGATFPRVDDAPEGAMSDRDAGARRMAAAVAGLLPPCTQAIAALARVDADAGPEPETAPATVRADLRVRERRAIAATVDGARLGPACDLERLAAGRSGGRSHPCHADRNGGSRRRPRPLRPSPSPQVGPAVATCSGGDQPPPSATNRLTLAASCRVKTPSEARCWPSRASCAVVTSR